MSENIFAVRVESSHSFITIVETGLLLLDIYPASWYDEKQDKGILKEYFETQVDAQARFEEIKPYLLEWRDDDQYTLSIETIPREDWQNSWKENFHTQRISDRVVIKPSWESFEASDDDIVIEMDPGMSFGTGLHPTTRACIRFLEEIAPSLDKASFLDLGCGSGILSIAAAKLGLNNITAVDLDKVAIEATEKNCSLNDVQIECVESDLADFNTNTTFEVVAANILSHILVRFAPMISSLCGGAGESYLLLAGILNEQYSDVREIFIKQGFVEIKSVDEDEWTSGLFRRQTL